MTVKQYEARTGRVVIDLTQVPYFDQPPLVVQEASGLERVRPVAETAEDNLGYRADRKPTPADAAMRFGGGLGLATVMDVDAHSIRARARGINVMTILAASTIAAIAMIMLTMVVVLKP